MFCLECGQKVKEQVAFCPNCGKKLGQPLPTELIVSPTHKKLSLKTVFLLFLMILLIAGMVGGSYYYLKRPKTELSQPKTIPNLITKETSNLVLTLEEVGASSFTKSEDKPLTDSDLETGFSEGWQQGHDVIFETNDKTKMIMNVAIRYSSVDLAKKAYDYFKEVGFLTKDYQKPEFQIEPATLGTDLGYDQITTYQAKGKTGGINVASLQNVFRYQNVVGNLIILTQASSLPEDEFLKYLRVLAGKWGIVTKTPTPIETQTPTIPLTTSPTAVPTGPTMQLKVYFANLQKASASDCSKVFALERSVSETVGVARAALNELFKGPTSEEKKQGYTSLFSDETKSILKNIKITEGVCYVNLEDIRQIVPNANTSCGSAELLAEMETTLKQFPTIKKVIFAINGNPKTFYDWLQIGCTETNDFCDKKPFE